MSTKMTTAKEFDLDARAGLGEDEFTRRTRIVEELCELDAAYDEEPDSWPGMNWDRTNPGASSAPFFQFRLPQLVMRLSADNLEYFVETDCEMRRLLICRAIEYGIIT